MTPTPGGFLLVLAVLLPALGILVAVAAPGRVGSRVFLCLLPLLACVAGAIAWMVWQSGRPLVYLVGGWSPPLGIVLRGDGLSAAMLLASVLVAGGIGLFALRAYGRNGKCSGSRQEFAFWPLFLGVWSAMNLIFVGNDLFNLYVALEILTFAAIPLVALDGTNATLNAALRYLLFALVGSVLYLLGVALLYGAYGTLDLGLLRDGYRGDVVTGVAVAALTVGLAAKSALFPFHFWLPPAHGSAPPPVSALLSALVVKGSFFVMLRVWCDMMPGAATAGASQVLGALGAGAIVTGGVMALRQERLKLLIAYSTVAQIGYLFVMFPLAARFEGAVAAGVVQAIAHALAKAAMFLGTGLVIEVLGHDRIAGLRGFYRQKPVLVGALILSALSLVGVPPTGGFVGKWMLVMAAIASGQWWWVAVILAGGLLAGSYMFRALSPMLSDRGESGDRTGGGLDAREAVVFALAVAALVMGFFPQSLLVLLESGWSVFPAAGAVP